MTDNNNVTTGFPVRKQLFGGFKRDDVTEYIETLIAKVELERTELEEGKKKLYDLMQNGQTFCDELTAQARHDAKILTEQARRDAEELTIQTRRNADALMEKAGQKADQILREAAEEFRQLQEKRGQLLAQTQADLEKLVGVVNTQQRQSTQAYENMIRPITAFLYGLEGDDDAS